MLTPTNHATKSGKETVTSMVWAMWVVGRDRVCRARHTDRVEPNREPSSPLFDPAGLVAGDVADQVWPALLTQLHTQLDAEPGQHPARLLAVLAPAVTEARRAGDLEQITADLAADLDLTHPQVAAGDRFAQLVELVTLAEGPDIDALLWGREAPADAAAVLGVWEELEVTGPEEMFPVTVRHMVLATRAGHLTCSRSTPGVPEPVFGRPTARAAAVARVVGAPAPEPAMTVGPWLGRLALARAAAGLISLGGEELPEVMMLPTTLRQVVDNAPPDQADLVREKVAEQTMTAAVGLVASLATMAAAGAGDLDEQVREALTYGPTPEGRRLLGVACAQIGAWSWDQVLEGVARNLLPTPLGAHRRWCDGNTLGHLAAQSASQDATLAAIRAGAGPEVAAVAERVLADVGWSEPPART